MKELFKNIGILLISMVLLVGCQNKHETTTGDNQISEVECINGFDCVSRSYSFLPTACINYTCEIVDCVWDNDCSSAFGNTQICENNKCVSYVEDCEQTARIDYNHKNPYCKYIYGKCYCEDYVVDSPEKRIEKDNSVQLIDEEGHFENYIIFELKQENTEEPEAESDNDTGLCFDTELYLTNVSFTNNFVVSNATCLQGITARYIFDCSLPEVNNYTVEIVFKDEISIAHIEIPFTEFCKRLEKKC